jgi:hypothetical protein
MMNKANVIGPLIDRPVDGIATRRLKSWKYFDAAVRQVADDPAFVFRGQLRANWELESSLARELRAIGKDYPEFERTRLDSYLEKFKHATRCRRGSNPQDLDKMGWWALAQDHGMPTPLLDWTESPFVAAYFAFWESGVWSTGEVRERAVFALHRDTIKDKMTARRSHGQGGISFLLPEMDDNALLVNQRGLFSCIPSGESVETLVKRCFRSSNSVALIKLVIPESGTDRVDFLTYLNRMNINHVTLFPDIKGAAQYCKLKLQIDTALKTELY